MTVGRWSATALELIRGGYGVVQLVAPGLTAAALLPHSLAARGRFIARILGARQLVQACVSGARPSYPTLALGVEVDALHATSMLALACVSRRARRAALTDMALAASFAAAGALAARTTGWSDDVRREKRQ